MNRISNIWLVAVGFLIAYSGIAFSQEGGKEPLRLVQTIPLPNVKGRLDHMDVDVKGKRLFVAGLENGTFEVVDLEAGKWLCSIAGFKKAQGALFIPELNKLFLASGDDGMLAQAGADSRTVDAHLSKADDPGVRFTQHLITPSTDALDDLPGKFTDHRGDLLDANIQQKVDSGAQAIRGAPLRRQQRQRLRRTEEHGEQLHCCDRASMTW